MYIILHILATVMYSFYLIKSYFTPTADMSIIHVHHTTYAQMEISYNNINS